MATVGRRGLILAVGAGVAGMLMLRTIRPGGDVIEARSLTDAVLAVDGPREGPDDAEVRVASFFDYRCGVCRASHDALKTAAREAGVLLLHRDWPILGEASLAAARVAVAADADGRYPGVQDALMRSPALDEATLRRAVEDAGGEWPVVAARAATEAVAARLQANANHAFALGLRGTPGYLAGPVRLQGGLDGDGYARLFERAAREARRLG